MYNTKFDKEYSTQYIKEVNFLEDNGIHYVFVKKIDGLSTYKYTKDFKLFKYLSVFYKDL